MVFIAGLLASCQKNINDPSFIPAKTELNVAYGTDSLQKMDVYLPANRNTEATPVIILIHGGAWASGDKSDFTPYVDSIRQRLPEYAIFNINYRLSNSTSIFFPSQENDVKAAADFIYNLSAQYKVSGRWVILGASAGAHLALLQSYKYSTPVKVKAVVDLFGPTDMTDLYNHPASPLVPSSAIALIVGATPSSNPALYQQSSPINFVNAQSPPTILFHGGLDPLVSPSQSIALSNALQAAGVAQQYIFYPTEFHGWTSPNLTDTFDKIAEFLRNKVH